MAVQYFPLKCIKAEVQSSIEWEYSTNLMESLIIAPHIHLKASLDARSFEVIHCSDVIMDYLVFL